MKYLSIVMFACVLLFSGVSDASMSHSQWQGWLKPSEQVSNLIETPAGRNAIIVYGFSKKYGPHSLTKITCQFVDGFNNKVLLEQKNGYNCFARVNTSLPWRIIVRVKNEENQNIGLVVERHSSIVQR
jgi:hypothetical protein